MFELKKRTTSSSWSFTFKCSPNLGNICTDQKIAFKCGMVKMLCKVRRYSIEHIMWFWTLDWKSEKIRLTVLRKKRRRLSFTETKTSDKFSCGVFRTAWSSANNQHIAKLQVWRLRGLTRCFFEQRTSYAAVQPFQDNPAPTCGAPGLEQTINKEQALLQVRMYIRQRSRVCCVQISQRA